MYKKCTKYNCCVNYYTVQFIFREQTKQKFAERKSSVTTIKFKTEDG